MTSNTPVPAPTVAMTWTTYQRKGVIEARPWTAEDEYNFVKGNTGRISISPADRETGTVQSLHGGFVARNPDNHDDQWYIAPDYFAKHYASTPPEVSGDGGAVEPSVRPVGMHMLRAFAESHSNNDVRRMAAELLRLRSAAPVRATYADTAGTYADQPGLPVFEQLMRLGAPSAQSEADARDAARYRVAKNLTRFQIAVKRPSGFWDELPPREWDAELDAAAAEFDAALSTASNAGKAGEKE